MSPLPNFLIHPCRQPPRRWTLPRSLKANKHCPRAGQDAANGNFHPPVGGRNAVNSKLPIQRVEICACQRRLRLLPWSALLLLGACATRGPEVPAFADPSRYEFAVKTDNPLQRGTIDRSSLLDGAVRFAAPAKLFDYDARYSLQPSLPSLNSDTGADSALLAPSLAPSNEISLAPVQLLGSESLQQNLRMRLPFLLEQPLMISAQESTRGLLKPETLATSRSAQVQWAPAPVALGLRWTPADAAALAQPFSCQLSGTIELPGAMLTGRSGDGLKLQGQGCRASAPDRGLSGVEVSRYSATWQWQRKRSNSSVYLTMLEAAEHLNDSAAQRAPGYEFGASRAQTFGLLTAGSSVALRHGGNAGDGREPLDWSARASLRRQFADLALSASLQREVDPLWFLPGESAGASLSTRSIELGVAFDRWIARQLATRHVGLGLIGRWTELPTADQSYDYRVLWNFTLTP